MTPAPPPALVERVARAMASASGNFFHPQCPDADWRSYLDEATAALSVIRAEFAAPSPGLWTVGNQDTYATLHRPDDSVAARFHVIAEADAVVRLINAAVALGGTDADPR